MNSGWHTVGTVMVRVEDDAPIEVRADAKPESSLIEDAWMLAIEHHLGQWLVWQDAWRTRDGETRRPIDLASQQPSHLAIFEPDGGEPVRWLLVVEASADGTTVAWTKEEWFSSGCRDGGSWVRDRAGWMISGKRTPEGVSGVLCVEALGRRAYSTRRSR